MGIECVDMTLGRVVRLGLQAGMARCAVMLSFVEQKGLASPENPNLIPHTFGSLQPSIQEGLRHLGELGIGEGSLSEALLRIARRHQPIGELIDKAQLPLVSTPNADDYIRAQYDSLSLTLGAFLLIGGGKAITELSDVLQWTADIARDIGRELIRAEEEESRPPNPMVFVVQGAPSHPSVETSLYDEGVALPERVLFHVLHARITKPEFTGSGVVLRDAPFLLYSSVSTLSVIEHLQKVARDR